MFGHSGSMTFPMSYDYEGEYYAYRKGWKGLSSLEKSLSVSLGVIAALGLALMIAVIVVGVKLNKDCDCKLVSPPSTTFLPTRSPQNPTSPCETEGTTRPRPSRPSSTTPMTTGDTDTTTDSTTDTTTGESIYIGSGSCISSEHNNATICLTPQCFRRAGLIMESLDYKVDPCKNFYQFACGNWFKNNPVPEDKQSWDQHELLEEKQLKEIRHILEMNTSPQDLPSVHLAKQFYHACMHKQDDVVGAAEMKVLLEEMTTNPDKETDPILSLAVLLGNIRRLLEGNYLISLEVDVDDRNTSKNAIYLDHPPSGLTHLLKMMDLHPTGSSSSNSQLRKDDPEMESLYKNLIEQLWSLVFPEDANNLETIVSEILEFERNLTIGITDSYEIDGPEGMYNQLSEIDDAQLSSTMVTWLKEFTDEIFTETSNKSGVTVFRNDDGERPNIIVKDVEYLRHLETVLNETDTETIGKYLRMRILLSFGPESGDTFKDLFIHFKQKVLNRKFCTSRWEACTRQTNELFGWAISTKFIHKSVDAKRQLNDTLNYLKEAFQETLEMPTLDWIASNETSTIAQHKMQLMKTFLAYPDWWTVETVDSVNDFVNQLYSDLNFTDPSNYLQSYIETVIWLSKKKLSEVYEPTIITTEENENSAEKWPKFEYPTKTRSRYIPNLNSLVVPAGLTDRFDTSMNILFPSLNYGGVGIMAARNMFRLLMKRVRRYRGVDGSLQSWWDNDTASNYMIISECFREQLSSLLEAGHHERSDDDTKQNVRELVLENGALTLAYSAYHTSSYEQEYDEVLLPGLQDYTPEQLFFLSFAQSQCSAERHRGAVGTSWNTRSQMLVEGALKNSVEFAKHWKCPLPVEEHTCRIF
ncbi:Neprilysin-1 [Orchesella cincta]|uniref:Neprilysin-1 n=1 Tax=Orchesella cincta TaxID=48709 RepID=A0A1D2MK16_ORCCI|nr:Neprilysin-1 [Orchesella cincta]